MNNRIVLAVPALVFSVAICAQQVPEPSHVDTAMAMAHQNDLVEPVYPAAARAAGIEGTVWVEAHIGPDGRVHQAKAISGPVELRQAAVESVLRRTFVPFNRNQSGPNAYVNVVADLPVDFRMPLLAEERNPLSIGALPKQVRTDLASRGCTIPRYRGNSNSGYASGSFRSPGSQDYAVICDYASHHEQQILVYLLDKGVWKGQVRGDYKRSWGDSECYLNVSSVSPAAFREAMDTSGIGDDGRSTLSSKNREFLASLDHDSVGIDRCDKDDTFSYFDGKRWHEMAGGVE